MEQAGVQLIAQNANVYIGDLKDATNATNSFVDSTDKGGGRVSAAGQVMIGALRKVGEIAIEVFAAAAKATVAFVGDSISLAGDFDQKMSVLQATSGATAEEMEQLAAKAKELGSDLSLPATSAVDAGEAMLELAKAGFTVQEQMDATKGVLQLAAAAQIDEAKAAEINANALQAFGLAAKESMFVSDLLAASANASSINATDMADTYKMAGAIFSAFQGPVVGSKQALIDLTTAASLLGNAGIKGSDAGTALKQSLLQLTAPSDKAKGLMKDLAVDIGVAGDIAYDAAGNMRSFPEILGLVSESTKSLSEEQRNYIVSTIFGADAARAILILMQQGPDAWDKMTDAVTRQGAAQDLAAAQTKGWNGALEGAKSQIETLQLTIGQALTPVLAELLNTYVSPAIASITAFAESFLKLAPAIAKSDDPIQSFLNALKITIPGAMDVINVIENVKDTLTNIIGVFNRTGGAADGLGAVVTDLGGVWQHYIEIVQDVLGGYQAIAQAVLPIITKFIDEHGTEIQAFFKTTWDSIVKIVTLALDIYDTIVPPVLNTIADFIEDHGSEIGKIFGGVWEMVTSIITGALETIKGVLSLALNVMHGDWDAAWEDIKNIGKAQWDAITGFLSGFLDAIAGLFDTSLAEIGQTWSDNWNSMVNLINDIGWWDAGKMIVEGLQEGINDAWNSLLSWFNEKVAGLVDAAMEAIGAASPAKEFMPVGQFAVQGIMQGLTDTWPALIDTVGDLSNDLVDEMRSIGEQMQNAVADSFGATASIDRQIAKNLDSFKDVLPEYASFTQGALKQAQDEATAFLDPAEGAKFFQMRSKQILEYAKLQKQLSEAESQEDKDRIAQQMLLINQAQTAEISQFNAQAQAQSLTQSLWDQVNEIMGNIGGGTGLTDAEIAIQNLLAGVLSQLQTPITTRADAYAHPPQMQYPTSGSTTSNRTTNVSMPIYTNNSPAALQQSWAIVQASMP
jgi:TP901 family phage tail tape measure protein